MGADSPSPTLCSPPHRIFQQGTNSQVLSATILLCFVRLLRERMYSVRPQPSLLFGFLPRHRSCQGRSYGRRHLLRLRARPSQARSSPARLLGSPARQTARRSVSSGGDNAECLSQRIFTKRVHRPPRSIHLHCAALSARHSEYVLSTCYPQITTGLGDGVHSNHLPMHNRSNMCAIIPV